MAEGNAGSRDAHPVGRERHPSLPAGWERVVSRIRRLYGHEVHLEIAEQATRFTETGDFLLYIDGELAGSIRRSWSDEWPPEEILAYLSEQIEEGWAQDLGGGFGNEAFPRPGIATPAERDIVRGARRVIDSPHLLPEHERVRS